MKKITSLAIIAISLAIFLYNCAKKPTEVSGGVETGNVGLVHGHLYNSDKTPAANATVQFVLAGHNPQTGTAIAASAITDVNGEYRFDSLKATTYNLFGQGGSGVCFRDSIEITKDTLLPNDTLKAPGSLHGVVRLEPGNDSAQIFIILLGTNYYTMPSDTNGNFTISNMAEGGYRAIVLTTSPNYASADTMFSIAAGQNTVIADTIRLRKSGAPTPTGLKIHYDTLRQVVTLTWNSNDTILVNEYKVYRQNSRTDSAGVKITSLPATDTVFIDSTVTQDETYFYRVSSVDRNGNEGLTSSIISAFIANAFQLIGTIGDGKGNTDGQLDRPVDLAVRKDGRIFITDDTIGIKIFSSEGNYISQIPCSFFGQMNLKRVLKMAVDSTDGLFITGVTNQVFGGNGVVFKLNSSDSFAMAFGNTGGSDSGLGFPMHISILDTVVFVENTNDRKIKAFSCNTGTYLYSIGGTGTIGGQFVEIKGMGIDSHKSIIVSEETRIQMIALGGAFISSFNINVGVPSDVQINSKDIILLISLTQNNMYGFDASGHLSQKLSFGKNKMSSFNLDIQDNMYFGISDAGIFQKYRRK